MDRVLLKCFLSLFLSFFLVGCCDTLKRDTTLFWQESHFIQKERALSPYLRAVKMGLMKVFYQSDVVVLEEKERVLCLFPDETVFQKGSATPNSALEEDLKKIVIVLKRYPHAAILVEGFSDKDGLEKKNKALSERRAHQVMSYLEAHGILAYRLVAIGRGESEPHLLHTHRRNEAAFRRVELSIYPITFDHSAHYYPYPLPKFLQK